MLSLTTMFSLMMLPALAVLVVSFVISVFEKRASTSVKHENSVLNEGMLF